MILDNILLLVVAGVFSMLALVVNFYIGVEVIHLIREAFAQFTDGSRRRRTSSKSDDHQVGVKVDRTITPFQDRGTVERLIGHLQEGEEEE